MRLFLALLFTSCGLMQAQVSMGLKLGVPVTDNFVAGSIGLPHNGFQRYGASTKPYTIGPSATLLLPLRLGVEVNCLYRRLNYDSYSYHFVSAGDGGSVYQWMATSGNRFDIPLLLQWMPLKSFFASAGPSFSVHSGFSQRLHRIQNLVIAGNSDTTVTTTHPAEKARSVGTGVTLGFGYDAGPGPFHLKPEIRYTRSISPAFESFAPVFSPVVNEWAFLLGLEFGGRR